MNCPRCQSELESLSDEVAVHGCRACHGVFLDNLASQLLVKDQLPAMVRYPYALSGEPVPPDEEQPEPVEGPFRSADVPLPACPTCSKPMRAMTASGVHIDVCAEHGTWMDAGEAELIRKLRAFDAALKVAQAKDSMDRSIAASAHAAEQAAVAHAQLNRDRTDWGKGAVAVAFAVGRLLND